MLDQKISRDLALVQDLKAQRNTLLPISRLPPEILCQIFREVRGNHDYANYEDDRLWTGTSHSEPCLNWISVSHVSRQWRCVAINDAHLWTDPPLKNPQWTMTMLERSRMTTMPAITLNIDELDKHVVNAFTPHIPRVSHLVLPQMARDTLRQFLSGLPQEAPRLEALSINCLARTDSEDATHYIIGNSSVDQALPFPNHRLCYTPKLRRLQLNGVVIDWNSHLLSHLTTLSMSRIPNDSKPTPNQFRMMLQSAPNLKRLHLTDVCPSLGRNEGNHQAIPILMQHLEHLSVEGTMMQLLFFFRSLVAPALTGVTVHMDFDEHFVSDFSAVLSAMKQPYLTRIIGSGADVRRLELGEYEGSLYVRASQILISERHIEPDERAPDDYSAHALTMWIDSGFEDDEESMDEIKDIVIPALFNNFDWTGLSELDIAYLVSARPSILASTFGALPQLRIVIADDDIAPWLFVALNLSPNGQSRNNNPSKSNSFSFPGLRHLAIGRTASIPVDRDFQALRKSLQDRYENGIPIISLKLDWNPSRAWACLLLKQCVTHVVIKPSRNGQDVVDNYSPYNHDWYL